MSKLLIKTCNENNISPNELIELYTLIFPIVSNNVLSINNLYDKQLVDINHLPTEKGKRLIADYSNALSILEGRRKTNSKQVDSAILETEINNWIDDYRKLFKGFKMGAMGDKKACTTKMITFFKEYPEYANKEIIFKAVKMYINSVNDTRYLMRADYFIFKNDQNSNRVSNLAIHAEEVDLEKEELTHNIMMI